MWALENNTPFAAERTWVRDRNGAEIWIVAVKGTWEITRRQTLLLAEKQEPIIRVPTYRDKPGESSLLYESDLVHTKPTTDILLHGTAYAPRGKPVRRVDVTLKVANLSKTLCVFGNRKWNCKTLTLSITEPEPFVEMPLLYERAYGGVDQSLEETESQRWHSDNPVGTGYAKHSENLHDQFLPNIEYPDQRIGIWNPKGRTAGFGPIARPWAPRVELSGTYDEKWERENHPLLPADFDDRFYLCAPEDQRPKNHLRGGEAVELQNFTPSGILRFHLPKVELHFETFFRRGESIVHPATLHSVILEPDVPRVLIVWHTLLSCHFKVHKLLYTSVNCQNLNLN